MALKDKATWVKIAFIPLIVTMSIADFTTECQRPCDCRWQSGNKAAICSNSSLRTVPGNLSNDIQILDLSNNNLQQLSQEAFMRAGLSNLKKLFLKDCNIEVVHKTAFVTLAIMIELDLSKNRIRSLHADTFRSTEKLRLINLSNNLIDKLEDGLFRNLKFLQKVEASNNRIVKIGTTAFANLPQLKILRLDGNNLSHMKPETLMALKNLSGLDLHNNPWRCDCNLQAFRDWVLTHNLYTAPTACAEPQLIEGKLWIELDASSFACRPTILEPLPDTTLKSYDENVTLICKVVGNPPPAVAWRFNGRVIELKSFGELRYSVSENTMDLIKWVNLTIINVRYSDKGNYTCVAENPGGRDEKSLALALSRYGGAGLIAGMNTDSFAILIGCLTAIIIIFGAVLVVCHFSTQNNEIKRLIKNDTRSSNGEILLEGSVESETEKSIKTDVNPISKPPRKYDAPPLFNNEATEMSELNKTLLDNESVLAMNDESNRNNEVEYCKLSQEALLIDRLTQDHQAYPPDLLSFPLRGSKLSSGDPPRNIESPIKSPAYGSSSLNLAIYNRSQTPAQGSFMSPKGYVTLPRRPRIPESNHRPQQVFSTLNGVIPYYDNMKLFHNGGNYYSLNKSEMDLGPVGKSSYFEDEGEPAPSPAPGTPHATIPRSSISSPNIHNQMINIQAMAPSHLKMADQRNLKVMLADSESFLKSPRETRVGYNVVSGTIKRTAPKPPPKPKKRVSCDVKEQFLNSSDNATEV